MELTSPPTLPTASAVVRMPDFAGGTHAHRHTVHSALISLEALGVSPQRITLRRVGRHALAPGLVAGQRPRAGEALTGATTVTLEIAGPGFTHALPVGMWESGGEAGAGTSEILEHLDDPLEKLKHWFHEGAPLFRIAPSAPAACARWIRLFGIDPATWPQSMWYPLASVVARLPQISCSSEGCRLLLDLLLGLPVREMRYRPCTGALPASALSRLGSRSSRLGVDMLLGDSAEDLAMLEIEIGPVPLESYVHFAEAAEGRDLLRRVLEMALPMSHSFAVRWTVADEKASPRLGIAEQNSRLGINTHLGSPLAVEPAEESDVREMVTAGGWR